MIHFKICLGVFIASSVLLGAQSQEGSTGPGLTDSEGVTHHCGHDHNQLRLLDNAVYQEEREKLNQFTEAYSSKNSNQADCGYVIPVVFHLHNTPGVTLAQLQSAIDILNEDYSATNPDISNIYSPYNSIVADVGITFRMATIDPSGNSTDGYTVHSQDLGGEEYYQDINKQISVWPCDSYLNIWVVNQAYDYSDYSSGWAYLPSTYYANQGVDGIVFNHRYLGYGEGTSEVSGPNSWQAEMGRVLTHEVGHYLNLEHTFYNYCDSQNDYVDDTPLVYYAGSGYCPAYYDGTSVSYCSGVSSVNLNNYMDYSSCPSMFTEGQKTRMMAALNSSIGYRNNLWTCENQEATGVSSIVSVHSQDLSLSAELLPNPGIHSTNLKFNSLSNEQVHIQLIDVIGRVVYNMHYQPNGTGEQQVSIPLSDVKSGMYFVAVKQDIQESTLRLTVIK